MKWSQRIALLYLRTRLRLLSVFSLNWAARSAFRLFCTPQRRHRKPLPRLFEEAEPLTFLLDGIRVRGWRWNQPGTRKVLILHGFESSAVNFERYVRPLMRNGLEVLAFDAPAHGRSEGRIVNAPLYKKMIREVVERYGPIHSFMAHSFGGLSLALALEELPHRETDRVVLIAPAAETTTAIDGFFRFLGLSPALRTAFDQLIRDRSGVGPEWFSIRRILPHIRARILWVHDEEDDVTPVRDALRVKEADHPHVTFLFTKGLGHRRIYRDNNVTRRIVDFL
ncbi:MAG: hypothetical protein RJA57_1565 [Bacteroidota bacterium]|jgi:pimeloyl-ACP methyl ester carboxylesterase